MWEDGVMILLLFRSSPRSSLRLTFAFFLAFFIFFPSPPSASPEMGTIPRDCRYALFFSILALRWRSYSVNPAISEADRERGWDNG